MIIFKEVDEFVFFPPVGGDTLESTVPETPYELELIFRSVRSAANREDQALRSHRKRSKPKTEDRFVEPIQAYRLCQLDDSEEQILCVVLAKNAVDAARKLGCPVEYLRPLE